MAHEEEQEQYESDCHDHKKAWHLWQIRANGTEQWVDLTGPPAWDEDFEYRRIEPQFQPECFSGLNWQEALKKGLAGREVEFSNDAETWTGPFKLSKILSSDKITCRFRQCGLGNWIYIRTCPETYQDKHPTITIGGVELPRPEVEAPKYGTKYWVWKPGNILHELWDDASLDLMWLKASRVHLTESRAQAWASWWEETVVKEINRD